MLCSKPDLQRFLSSQERDYATALAEVRNEEKVTYWVWYVFPQLKGLGKSGMSQYYGIDGKEEAKAYIKHPVLGARLREITQALLDLPEGADLRGVFGYIDAKKVKSCMTLFHLASGEQIFMDVLNRYCEGHYCKQTLKMMAYCDFSHK